MNSRRLELHKLLVNLLGSQNVYFQPPEGKKLSYDCIVYSRARINTTFADNTPYLLQNRYRVTAIYRDPDSDLPGKIACFPMCQQVNHFTKDNLNHDIFYLTF